MPKGNGKPISKVPVSLKVESKENFIQNLQDRFEKNMKRHEDVRWDTVQERLLSKEKKLGSLYAMESTGGEPDVIGYDKKTDQLIFCDCSEQTPTRRSICYDNEGEKKRQKQGIKPGGNAVDLASAMGIELLSEKQYRELQEIGEFDTKTSSWIQTPAKIRKLGGALFCDRRYNSVFTYHNGADSFYSARGFRGIVRV